MSDRGAFWKLKEAQGDYVCAENSAFRRDVPALWRPWRLSQASCRAITCLTGLEAAGQRGASSMHAHYSSIGEGEGVPPLTTARQESHTEDVCSMLCAKHHGAHLSVWEAPQTDLQYIMYAQA